MSAARDPFANLGEQGQRMTGAEWRHRGRGIGKVQKEVEGALDTPWREPCLRSLRSVSVSLKHGMNRRAEEDLGMVFHRGKVRMWLEPINVGQGGFPRDRAFRWLSPRVAVFGLCARVLAAPSLFGPMQTGPLWVPRRVFLLPDDLEPSSRQLPKGRRRHSSLPRLQSRPRHLSVHRVERPQVPPCLELVEPSTGW
jgi:hypothetical protein